MTKEHAIFTFTMTRDNNGDLSCVEESNLGRLRSMTVFAGARIERGRWFTAKSGFYTPSLQARGFAN